MKTGVKPAKSKQFNRFGRVSDVGKLTSAHIGQLLPREFCGTVIFGVLRSEGVDVYNFQYIE